MLNVLDLAACMVTELTTLLSYHAANNLQPRAVLVVPVDARPWRSLPNGHVYTERHQASARIPGAGFQIGNSVIPLYKELTVRVFMLGLVFPAV